MNNFNEMLDQAVRFSSNYKEHIETITEEDERDSDDSESFKNELKISLDNLTELPVKSDDYVLTFMKYRLKMKQYYTWAGQALISVHPYQDILIKTENVDSNKPYICKVISKAWFKLNNNIGKKNQVLLISGESGSGKTYSACLALKAISSKNKDSGLESYDTLLWQAWSSVPLLTAFGNASTEHNRNSSRFGKLLQLQYRSNKIEGAYIQTYLLEKCRVSGPNIGEGNFHIFQQVLESLTEQSLNAVYLSKNINYKIAPKMKNDLKNTYNETIKSLTILKIEEVGEILAITSIILNLGNIKFHFYSDAYQIKPDTMNFLENVAKLLRTDAVKLAKLITTRTISAANKGKRRDTMYKSPCLMKEDCEERLNCLMRFLYVNLFLWIVKKINNIIYKPGDYNFIGILDIYGFEVFAYNTFEQLCINYANERLQQYFTKDYLMERVNDLTVEGFHIDSIDNTEYAARVSLLDGSISVFSILNEECMMKRCNSDGFVNSRITENLKSHTLFIPTAGDFGTEFSIKHYAGTVKYNSKNMVAKNKDKVPQDMIEFLINQCNFWFIKEIMDNEKCNNENTAKTILKKFKNSLDSLIRILDSSDVHYIKCIKPNPYQIPGMIEDNFFLNQLKTNGIFEILKLNFQNYAIKLCLEDYRKKFPLNLLIELQVSLKDEMHIGKKLIYLSENAYYHLEKLNHMKRTIAAIKIQTYYKKYASIRYNSFDENIINISKKSSSFDISLHEDDNVLSQLHTISPKKKVEEFVLRHSNIHTYEGDPISLILEKVFNNLETKSFKRTAFFGDRIVSYQKLAKVPVRLHLSKSCIPFSHVLPKNEMPKGIIDAL